ncbi:MAG: hypothetical protein PHW10_03805 [Candidatus Peribacteraceae bacterium]|nr:hypothetical protein [Candidatus Peribacteraceae bacterium]
MALRTSPEQGPTKNASVETTKLVVSQPKTLRAITEMVDALQAAPERVSELLGEDRSGDLGGASAGTGLAAGQGSAGQSARDIAIATMPSDTATLQRQLAKHIEQEVNHLRRIARKNGRGSRPGEAFRLNQIYARIRRLNALLKELFEASIDVLKRLFIRVFIDKQSII